MTLVTAKPAFFGEGDELFAAVRAGAIENELLKASLLSPNDSPPVGGIWLGEENRFALKSSGGFFGSICTRIYACV